MELNAHNRSIVGKKTKQLRNKALVPSVIFGAGKDSQNITVSLVDFLKVYKEVGESAIVDLKLGSIIRKVLIKHVDRDPVRSSILHVDFQEVSMSKKIKTQIPIKLVGESPAVKEHGAVLVRSLNAIDIECLPQDLVSEFSVDIARIANIGDVLRVSDLTFPAAIHVLTKPETVVALAEAVHVEAETPVTAAAAPDLSQVKTEQEEKRAAAQAKADEEKAIDGK